MKVGVHVSISSGFLSAAKTAVKLGAESFQYFPKNPRSLEIKQPDFHDADACRAFCEEHGLCTIAHAPYPANLSLEDREGRSRVARSLKNDLVIAESLGSIGVVVHFGKYKGKDPLQGYQNSIQCLNEALDGWKGRAKLLLENQAGEGTTIGLTFEECVTIRKLCDDPEHIGFCLDTCHLFASGVWTAENWSELHQRALEIGYVQQLCAIHLNDSMYASGSHRDRHANLGQGMIGLEPLKQLLTSLQGADIPVVMETAASKKGKRSSELELAKSLLRS
ncbi:deoxyribonuclease IV [Marinicrinis lubricantis]|uniref:Deoxyribonuclease IV n=1 Tax=Marinicrinis lubricantis TaxID=2086470 RepID=A0ABW1IUC0_9BACL